MAIESAAATGTTRRPAARRAPLRVGGSRHRGGARRAGLRGRARCHRAGARRRALLDPRLRRDGVMRFKAWRGLSDEYRRAVEGHSPWPRDVHAPEPIVVPDVESDPAMAPYLPLFREEGIGALAFIPLVAGGRLIGKFMVYYHRAARALRARARDGQGDRQPRGLGHRAVLGAGGAAADRAFQRDVHGDSRARSA